MSWQVMHGADGNRHVVPKDDLRPHRCCVSCWCSPKVDTEDEEVIIHNSADQREAGEGATRQ